MTGQKSITRVFITSFLLAFLCRAMVAKEIKAGDISPGSRISGAFPVDQHMEGSYTLTAKVRPLLFWISRPGVGSGHLTWIEDTKGGKKIELLIGSDPDRTPMRINRWGYIVENSTGTSVEVLGIMTASEEQSIEQAQTSTKQTGSQRCKAIRSHIMGGQMRSTTTSLSLGRNYTFRDAPGLLENMPATENWAHIIPVPAGTMPGFLLALKSLIHESVEKYHQSGSVDASRRNQRNYIYDATIFNLRLKSSQLISDMPAGGCVYHRVIESEFESQNTATGKTSSFAIAYATGDSNSEIPIRIVYRPRWWFEVELVLEGPIGHIQTAEGRTSWNP
jgi:hypothetical protein